MFVQVLHNGFFETAGAEAVDHPHHPLFAEQAFVQELFEPIQGLVDSAAYKEELAG